MPLLLFFGYHNLDSIVNDLQDSKNDEINYYYDFLGHRLYSDTVTIESAYQEVFDMTREEYRDMLEKQYQQMKKIREEFFKKTREEALERKERIINLALEVIPEDKMQIFIDELPNIGDLYPYNEERAKCYLEIIKELNNDNYSLDKVKELFTTIKPFDTPGISSLLKSIKVLAKHGDVLFNEYHDVIETAEQLINDMKKNIENYINSPILPEKKITIDHDKELDMFDIKLTLLRECSYQSSEENNKTL